MPPCGSRMTVAQLRVAVKAKQPNLAVSRLNKTQLLDFYEGKKKMNPVIPKSGPALVKNLTAKSKSAMASGKKASPKAPKIPAPLKAPPLPPMPPKKASTKMASAGGGSAPKKAEQLPAHIIKNIREMGTGLGKRAAMFKYRDTAIKELTQLYKNFKPEVAEWDRKWQENGYSEEYFDVIRPQTTRANDRMIDIIDKFKGKNGINDEWDSIAETNKGLDDFLNPVRKEVRKVIGLVKQVDFSVQENIIHFENNYSGIRDWIRNLVSVAPDFKTNNNIQTRAKAKSTRAKKKKTTKKK